ncbi:DNA-binding MurR/RpiR family transcriptional regulator [Scopulibacillus daqui]|uniref:DNA-binding MurR/RpiR family transcriptional regulator n=1 Tax=Scopulibacillus daqui TaxID=1469162 RepID=A0ABS2Q1Z1_9BACL|nr:MurR/RpiR family transcriptional regulator [Scopulibacillus daqui]MBM7645970.1 DNA-binding MurR/RpiR family transcriptional regulator [Scopulibacillus daqui]
MTISSITSQIKAALPDLPESEQKVAEYIRHHPKEVIKMSIHETAKKAGTSSAAIVRFCRSMGLDGFPDLKMRLSIELAKPRQPGYLDIEANEEVESIIEKVMSNTLQTLQITAGHLDSQAIKRTIDVLRQASVIYVYGVGASYIVAEDVAQKWKRLGKSIFAVSDCHVLSMNFAASPPNAVFFGISYSGNTPEVIHLTELANEYGLTTIGLSRFGNNKLSQTADIIINTARAPEAELRSAATTSRFAQLLVIDVLFFAYASSQYDFTVNQLAKTREAVEAWKKKF